jgi:hypothetical protein
MTGEDSASAASPAADHSSQGVNDSAATSSQPDTASTSDSTVYRAAGAAGSLDAGDGPPGQDTAPPQPSRKKKKEWEPLSVPQPMQIMQEDIMNNCFVKGGLSAAMGGIAGFAFGLFSASLENAGAGVSEKQRSHPGCSSVAHMSGVPHLLHA